MDDVSLFVIWDDVVDDSDNDDDDVSTSSSRVCCCGRRIILPECRGANPKAIEPLLYNEKAMIDVDNKDIMLKW